MKRFFIYVGLAVLTIVIAAACGDDATSDPPDTSPTIAESPAILSPAIPSPTADDDISKREDDLRQAATEAVQAFIDGDTALSYTFFAADYRERCPFGDYLGTVLFTEAFLGDISGAEATVVGIRFEGEQAFVDTGIELNGVDLLGDGEEDEYPDYWILEDGEWKSTSDDPAPCELLDFGAEDTETNECLDAYNKAVEEWNALSEANDSVYQQYTIGGEIGTGFEGWAEDNGYAEDFCTEE